VQCNGRLVAVAGDDVIDHLESLTLRYYDDFSPRGSTGRRRIAQG
jgi:hypothetical protein